jgi:hypothetical protein
LGIGAVHGELVSTELTTGPGQGLQFLHPRVAHLSYGPLSAADDPLRSGNFAYLKPLWRSNNEILRSCKRTWYSHPYKKIILVIAVRNGNLSRIGNVIIYDLC